MSLKVAFEFFPEKYYHLEFQCQVEIFVVTFDFVLVLFSVLIDLQLPFFLMLQFQISIFSLSLFC